MICLRVGCALNICGSRLALNISSSRLALNISSSGLALNICSSGLALNISSRRLILNVSCSMRLILKVSGILLRLVKSRIGCVIESGRIIDTFLIVVVCLRLGLNSSILLRKCRLSPSLIILRKFILSLALLHVRIVIFIILRYTLQRNVLGISIDGNVIVMLLLSTQILHGRSGV